MKVNTDMFPGSQAIARIPNVPTKWTEYKAKYG